MLREFGCETLEEFGAKVLPDSIRAESPQDLGAPLSETDALGALREFAAQNKLAASMLGLGYYGAGNARGCAARDAGKSGVVHRLHALSGGDFAGAAGNAFELSDDGGGLDRGCRPQTRRCWTKAPPRRRR